MSVRVLHLTWGGCETLCGVDSSDSLTVANRFGIPEVVNCFKCREQYYAWQRRHNKKRDRALR